MTYDEYESYNFVRVEPSGEVYLVAIDFETGEIVKEDSFMRLPEVTIKKYKVELPFLFSKNTFSVMAGKIISRIKKEDFLKKFTLPTFSEYALIMEVMDSLTIFGGWYNEDIYENPNKYNKKDGEIIFKDKYVTEISDEKCRDKRRKQDGSISFSYKDCYNFEFKHYKDGRCRPNCAEDGGICKRYLLFEEMFRGVIRGVKRGMRDKQCQQK